MRTYFCIGSVYGGPSLDVLLEHIGNLPPDFDRVVLIAKQNTKEAMGFPRVYNALVKAALHDPFCDVIWILGDDVLPKGRCILETQQVLLEDPTCGAMFPVEAWGPVDNQTDLNHESYEPFTGRILAIPRDLEEKVVDRLFAGFACAATRASVWREIGLLDESFGRGYGEDLDWGIRAWHAGWRCRNYRGAWFYHEQGATYKALIREGKYSQEEPEKAALKVQEKWPWLWREPEDQIMARLYRAYQEANEGDEA